MNGIVGLHDLRIDCIIGVLEPERHTVQSIFVDVEIETDIAGAVADDDVALTIDYAKVAEQLTEIADRKFQLLETYAHESAAELLLRYPGADRVTIEVRKPAAIEAAANSFVRVERRR